MPRRSSRCGSKPYWTIFLGSKPALGRVLARGVDGQHPGELLDRVVVPLDLGAVLHLVFLAVLVRRGLRPAPLEHAGLVPEHRRMYRERDTLLDIADLVEVDRALVVLRQVVAVRLDERAEIQPLPMGKASAPPTPTGPTMSGPLPEGDLRRERVSRRVVGHDLELEGDVGERRGHGGRDLFLGRHLGRVSPVPRQHTSGARPARQPDRWDDRRRQSAAVTGAVGSTVPACFHATATSRDGQQGDLGAWAALPRDPPARMAWRWCDATR